MLETSIVSVPANPNAVMDRAKAAFEAGELDEAGLELVKKSLNIPEPEPETKGIEVLEDWLAEHGFELKDGVPVKVEVKEPEPQPAPEPVKREIKVIHKPKRVVKVISTPEQVAKGVAGAVRDSIYLQRGGV